jgi:hypothetical protein
MDIALLGTALDYLLLACFSKALWWAAETLKASILIR